MKAVSSTLTTTLCARSHLPYRPCGPMASKYSTYPAGCVDIHASRGTGSAAPPARLAILACASYAFLRRSSDFESAKLAYASAETSVISRSMFIIS